jgi:hypothetical protein
MDAWRPSFLRERCGRQRNANDSKHERDHESGPSIGHRIPTFVLYGWRKLLRGTRPIQELSSPDGGEDPDATGFFAVARQSPHAP